MLKGLLLDIIMDTELFEMAFSRRELSLKIQNQADPLFEHITNIMMFSEVSDWDQTIRDIFKYINKMKFNKQNKKTLTNEFLLDNLYTKPYDEIDWDLLKNSKEDSKNMKVHYIPNDNDLEDIYIKLIILNDVNRQRVLEVFSDYIA